MTLDFYAGLSGLQLPLAKYNFPPEHQHRSRISYYATIFNSIEINSSFYKIPMHRTVARWAADVPQDFKFTFKLFKDLTHCKDLDFDERNVLSFIEAINNVAEKKGCILLQFPPSLTTTAFSQFRHLINLIYPAATTSGWKIAVEFRNNAWYKDEVFEFLQQHNAAMVMQDIPKSATPFTTPGSDFAYVRFHGPTGNYRGSYDEIYLSEYASYVNEWLHERKQVYTYFNNTAGDAYANALTFKGFIA